MGDGSDAVVIGRTRAEMFLDENVTPGRVYHYRVYAVGVAAATVTKDVAHFTVTTKPRPPQDRYAPTTPLGLRGRKKPKTIEWTWCPSQETPSSRLLGYFVEDNDAPQSRGFIYEQHGATQKWEEPVPAGGKRIYRLRAIDKDLNISAPSNVATGEAGGEAGVDSPRLEARYWHPLDEHHPSLEYPEPDSAKATLSLLDSQDEPVTSCQATLVDVPFTHYWFDEAGQPPSPSPEVVDEYVLALVDWDIEALDDPWYILVIEWEEVWTDLGDNLYLIVPAFTQRLPISWHGGNYHVDYRDYLVERTAFSGWRSNYEPGPAVITSDAEIWFCGRGKESWWLDIILGDCLLLAKDGPFLSVSFDYDNRCGPEGTAWGGDETGDARLDWWEVDYDPEKRVLQQGTSGSRAFDVSMQDARPADRRAYGLPPAYNPPLSWPWPEIEDLIIPAGLLLFVSFSWSNGFCNNIEWPDGGVRITNFSLSQGS
jgi:hypothetical protein